ncbi:MAG TPA: hypothetical protein VLI54_00885 [Bacillota bacterium]|nr:hypothetical protein [Bacillota bacterium]
MPEHSLPIEPSLASGLGDLHTSRAAAPNIEDVRVHQILTKLGVILHGQIAQANTFFMRGGGYDHQSAHLMDEIELAGWRSVFGIDAVVEAAVNERSLYVVNIDAEAPSTPPDSRTLVHPYTPEHIQRGIRREAPAGTVRVNYGGEAHWVPRDLVTPVEDTRDLTYLLRPQIHFGGQGRVAGHLYNAFVAIDTYVRAKNGTHLVSRIGETGIAGSLIPNPVYSPHTAVKTSLWMNTSIQDEPNNLSVAIDRPDQFMMRCALHNIDAIPQLDVPESDKIGMWFWQLNRLISNQTLTLPSAPPPQIQTP